jgi:hypothetical protein
VPPPVVVEELVPDAVVPPVVLVGVAALVPKMRSYKSMIPPDWLRMLDSALGCEYE